MLVKIGRHLKFCATLIFILTSILWLVVFVLIWQTQSDPRVQQLGLIDHITEQSRKSTYFRKLNPSFILHKFEFIELMNDNIPTIIGEEALLIISGRQQTLQQINKNFLYYLQKSSSSSSNFPIYVLKNKKTLVMPTEKHVQNYVSEIQESLNYLAKSVNLKKISILCFEETSLLMLKVLSVLNLNIFDSIKKVIMINPYTPKIQVYHSQPSSFIKRIQIQMVRDSLRFKKLNELKIIFIQTVDTQYPLSPKHYNSFNLVFNGSYQFSNTISLSTRTMWNVYANLNSDQYFRFQPFLVLFTKFFMLDHHYSLQKKQIEYFFLYREQPNTKQLQTKSQNQYLPKCHDFVLENYNYKGNVFKNKCIRVLRKDSAYFHNSSIIIFGREKYQVYGENLQRLHPVQTKGNQYIFLLQNLLGYSRFYIINSKQIDIKIIVTSVHQPVNNPVVYYESTLEQLLESVVIDDISVIKICPDYKMLFPTHFKSLGGLQRKRNIFLIQPSDYQQCYLDDDSFDYYWSDFIRNWKFSRNLMMFTLFCTHATGTSAFSKFYIHLFVNNCLSYYIGDRFMFFSNLVLLSGVVLIQTLLSILMFVVWHICKCIPKDYIKKMYFLPFVFEVVRWFNVYTFPSPWKVLPIEIALALHKENVIILFLELYFLIDYIFTDESSVFGLILVLSWLQAVEFKNMNQEKSQKANRCNAEQNASLEIVNKIFLILIAFCLDQDGYTMHMLINSYIIIYVLIVLRKLVTLQ